MTAVWRIELTLPSASAVRVFEASLEPIGEAVTSMEAGADGVQATGRWRLVAYGLADPDIAVLELRLALAAASAGIETPSYVLERLPDTDWVAAARHETIPVRAGRFVVHGSHHRGRPPAGAVAIRIDAAMAFGSGEHETTRGCLMAMDRLLLRRGPGQVERRSPEGVLDLGTGSGILAIAAAKAADAVVIAADNDPIAISIARENAEINGVSDRVRLFVSQGFRNRALRRSAPFDWILANILARPLIAMAPSLVGHLNRGGAAVLSGFLADQGETVVSAYEKAGVRVVDAIDVKGWRTLIVERD